MALAHSRDCDWVREEWKPCSCGTSEMEQEFSLPPGMGLKLILDGDGAWSDLKPDKTVHVTDGIEVAALAAGTTSGKPSVALRIPLPDGRVVIAETTLKLFLSAASALEAKFRR